MITVIANLLKKDVLRVSLVANYDNEESKTNFR